MKQLGIVNVVVYMGFEFSKNALVQQNCINVKQLAIDLLVVRVGFQFSYNVPVCTA